MELLARLSRERPLVNEKGFLGRKEKTRISQQIACIACYMGRFGWFWGRILGMLLIERPSYDTLLLEAQNGLPLEVCGLLAGKNGRITHTYPIHNKLQSPVAFEMEPLPQIQTMLTIEEAGMELLGIYHSHPTGPAQPSETDIAQAYYPEIAQFIVSLKEGHPIVNAFLIENGRFRVIPFAIESG